MDKKWNLQDIKPAERRRSATRMTAQQPHRSVDVEEITPPAAQRRTVRSRSDKPVARKSLWIALAAVIVLATGGIIVTALTSKTTVSVFPRWREPTVNAIFQASTQAAAAELAYEVMTLEAEGVREVTATGQEEVEEQATGQITIYKTTSGSERLITNTRFETSNGLIYRLRDPAVVPGATEAGPGSVVADVFADQTGPEYNLAEGQRFTVPGFRENNLTELYDAIYAENLAPITGGHKGPKFIIDSEELAVATESLRSELQEALRSRVAAEKPAGFAIFDDAIRFTYTALPAEDLGNGKVKIREKATLQLPMFKSGDFASYIAASTIPGYEGEPVRIESLEPLTFEYATEPNLSSMEPISFKLLGRPKIIWTYDEEQLKKDLAGGSQTALNTVLGGYPAIERATAVIKPFWKRSFPDDPAKISIKENLSSE